MNNSPRTYSCMISRNGDFMDGNIISGIIGGAISDPLSPEAQEHAESYL